MATITSQDRKVKEEWNLAYKHIINAMHALNDLSYDASKSQLFGNLKNDAKKAHDMIQDAGRLITKYEQQIYKNIL